LDTVYLGENNAAKFVLLLRDKNI